MTDARKVLVLGLCLAALPLAATHPAAQAPVRALQAAAATPAALDPWLARVDAMLERGTLDLGRPQDDTMLPGRRHERLVQRHDGLPVFGGELVRQYEDGRVVSVFGRVYEPIDVNTRPDLDAAGASAVAVAAAGGEALARGEPQLGILPLDEGRAVLAWRVTVGSPDDVQVVDVDARSGAVVQRASRLRPQVAGVGTGTGVTGTRRKVVATRAGGRFEARDQSRPAQSITFDFRGSQARLNSFLLTGALNASDIATDDDNTWTDAAVVDAHAIQGLAYDYFFKRYGRRGMDDRNGTILSIVHPLARGGNYDNETRGRFLNNAVYLGDNAMLFGDGDGTTFDFLAGSLDVVVHEWAHGVTEAASDLVYRDEPGALNESFSDIMGAAAEFFFEGARADWVLGEDVTRNRGFIRSMSNPIAAGHPDHYSQLRFIGTDTDNGGVHVNSGVPNHVFYLAVAGGTHRVSGLTVQGVGMANLERMERIFYRGFVFYLGPSSRFSDARAATLQAATDLFGAGSNERLQLERAWTAVGVQ